MVVVGNSKNDQILLNNVRHCWEEQNWRQVSFCFLCLLFSGRVALYVETGNFNRTRNPVRSSATSICGSLCDLKKKKKCAFEVFAVLSADDRQTDAASHGPTCRSGSEKTPQWSKGYPFVKYWSGSVKFCFARMQRGKRALETSVPSVN